jgi:beta-phosphoglucomutase-like phosphatase (HAD superfamily)
MVLTDTHPNAARVQLELMRAAGHARRSELMNRYSQELIRAARLRLLQKHQGNDFEAKLEWVKIQYGAKLEQKVRAYLVGQNGC